MQECNKYCKDGILLSVGALRCVHDQSDLVAMALWKTHCPFWITAAISHAITDADTGMTDAGIIQYCKSVRPSWYHAYIRQNGF